MAAANKLNIPQLVDEIFAEAGIVIQSCSSDIKETIDSIVDDLLPHIKTKSLAETINSILDESTGPVPKSISKSVDGASIPTTLFKPEHSSRKVKIGDSSVDLYDITVWHELPKLFNCYQSKKYLDSNKSQIETFKLLYAYQVAKSLVGPNAQSINLPFLIDALSEREPSINWLNHITNDSLFFNYLFNPTTYKQPINISSKVITNKKINNLLSNGFTSIKLNSMEKEVVPTLLTHLLSKANHKQNKDELLLLTNSFNNGVEYKCSRVNINPPSTRHFNKAKARTSALKFLDKKGIRGHLKTSSNGKLTNLDKDAWVDAIVKQKDLNNSLSNSINNQTLTNFTFKKSVRSANSTTSISRFKYESIRAIAESPKNSYSKIFDDSTHNVDENGAEIRIFNKLNDGYDLPGTSLREIAIRTGFGKSTISRLLSKYSDLNNNSTIERFSEHTTPYTTKGDIFKYLNKTFKRMNKQRVIVRYSTNNDQTFSIFINHSIHFIDTASKHINSISYVLPSNSLQTYGQSRIGLKTTSLFSTNVIKSIPTDTICSGIHIRKPKFEDRSDLHSRKYSKQTIELIADSIKPTMVDSNTTPNTKSEAIASDIAKQVKLNEISFDLKSGGGYKSIDGSSNRNPRPRVKISNLLTQSKKTIGWSLNNIPSSSLTTLGRNLQYKYNKTSDLNQPYHFKPLTHYDAYLDNDGAIKNASALKNSANEYVLASDHGISTFQIEYEPYDVVKNFNDIITQQSVIQDAIAFEKEKYFINKLVDEGLKILGIESV